MLITANTFILGNKNKIDESCFCHVGQPEGAPLVQKEPQSGLGMFRRKLMIDFQSACLWLKVIYIPKHQK
jgi:hypothetical protein